MVLPDYWLPRPSVTENENIQVAFKELFITLLGNDYSIDIRYSLPWPKWQFLCYVADRHDIVLHGSGEPDIAQFEPRQSNDIDDFGNQKAVYAASDGIWAMFFAIVDRSRFAMSVNNACIRLTDEVGLLQDPYYVFSISQTILLQQPWRTGTVYLLPRGPFTPQPRMTIGSQTVHIAQLASNVPVRPLAKLAITPEDFPFLKQIRGHDDQRLAEIAAAVQTGAPWPEN